MPTRKRAAFLALCLGACAGFVALGVWQLQRLAWKLDLIARVDARVNAAPVAAPPRAEWATLSADDIEYRRVHLDGRWLDDKTTRVDALTAQGPGVWVLTPLATDAGIVLVNRGFLPRDRLSDPLAPASTGSVVGLMRLSEPGGRLLRPNRPPQDVWFSRDVAAIAAARGLSDVAPFFVDAERTPAGTYPIGGLTVLQFRNMHAVYAATWFALAALAGFGAWQLLAERKRSAAGPSG